MIEQRTIAEKETPKERRIQFYKIWNYRTFLLLIIVGAMINNLDHSAELYMKISERVSTTQAYSVVIIFDLIVIALIGVGDSKALLFAISVFFINELAWDGVKVFYEIWMKAKDVDYVISDSMNEYLTLIEKAITMLIYGGTFAFTVHHFSNLFKKELQRKEKHDSIISKLRNMVADLRSLHADEEYKVAELNKLRAEHELKLSEVEQNVSANDQLLSASEQQLQKLGAEVKKLRDYKSAMVAELTCTCGQQFEKLSEKYGHQRKCNTYKVRSQ